MFAQNFQVNHATTRVLTKKRTDNAISAGGNKGNLIDSDELINSFSSTDL